MKVVSPFTLTAVAPSDRGRSTSPPPPSPAPRRRRRPTSSPIPIAGYDLVGSDGGVFVFPTGQTSRLLRLAAGPHVVPVKPIVGLVPTVERQGLFPGGLRRRGLLLRHSAVPRLAARQGGHPHRSRSPASWPPTQTRATSWWAETAGSSPSARCRSWGRCRARGSRSTTSSASPPPPQAGATGWCRPQDRLRLRQGQAPGHSQGDVLAGLGHRRHPHRRGLLDHHPERRSLPLRQRQGLRHTAGLKGHPLPPGRRHRPHRRHSRLLAHRLRRRGFRLRRRRIRGSLPGLSVSVGDIVGAVPN